MKLAIHLLKYPNINSKNIKLTLVSLFVLSLFTSCANKTVATKSNKMTPQRNIASTGVVINRSLLFGNCQFSGAFLENKIELQLDNDNSRCDSLTQFSHEQLNAFSIELVRMHRSLYSPNSPYEVTNYTIKTTDSKNYATSGKLSSGIKYLHTVKTETTDKTNPQFISYSDYPLTYNFNLESQEIVIEIGYVGMY